MIEILDLEAVSVSCKPFGSSGGDSLVDID